MTNSIVWDLKKSWNEKGTHFCYKIHEKTRQIAMLRGTNVSLDTEGKKQMVFNSRTRRSEGIKYFFSQK